MHSVVYMDIQVMLKEYVMHFLMNLISVLKMQNLC